MTASGAAEVGAARPHTAFRDAARWNLVGSAARQGITLSATFLLVVLLDPADFGAASVALAIVLLWQTAIQQGLLPVLVARPVLSQVELTSAHWLLVLCGLLATTTTALSAGQVATVAGAPVLAGVLHALSVFVLVESLAVPHEAVVRRAMDGRGLALRGLLAPSAGAATGVLAALLGAGVWALVGQQLVVSVTNLLVLVVRSGWRPTGLPRWRALRPLAPLAWRSSAGGLGQALDARADLLLVGLVLGPTSAGLYRLAGRLVDAAHDVTCRAVVTVSLAELGRTADVDLARRARDISERTAAVSAPALGLLAGSASAVTGLLGAEWRSAAPALSILCLSSLLMSTTSTLVPLLQRRGRLGRTSLLAWAGAGTGLAFFGGLTAVVGGLRPVEALAVVAAGRVLLQSGECVAAVVAVRRELSVRTRDLVSPLVLRHHLVALLVAGSAWGVAQLPPPGSPALLVVGASVAGGASCAGLLQLTDARARGALRARAAATLAPLRRRPEPAARPGRA
ncbi:oligosaccharide flippase family protein [Pseudokineococcus basanitobsidens]|uniref:Oligosaccharide flippase family protein n=1 Tax=Pseudokineococcus basanitobsidens TaxID=1926649 RepID=A0ABU8RI72_9ACTN